MRPSRIIIEKTIHKSLLLVNKEKKNSSETNGFRGVLVRVAGFEPTASWSRTKRATNCATPGCCIYLHSMPIIRKKQQSVKEKLAVFLLLLWNACTYRESIMHIVSNKRKGGTE